jgi:hypothetical protein
VSIAVSESTIRSDAPAAGEPAPAERAAARRGVFWLVLVAGLVVLALLSTGTRSDGVPFSPRSAAPSGALALRYLMESHGTDVEMTSRLPPPGPTRTTAPTVFVLVDQLTDDQRAELESWVRRGGRLVVADRDSPLIPRDAAPSVAPFGGSVELGGCTVACLTDARSVQPGPSTPYRARTGDRQCFAVGDGFLVLSWRSGAGEMVAVGAPELFTNQRLAERDNAFVALELLEVEPGAEVVWLQRDPQAPSLEPTLWDHVGPGARAALVQLLIAGLVWVFVRARRLGRPVVEAQPVALEGSALVSAVGGLLQRRRDPSTAARALRRQLRAELCRRRSLAPDTSPDSLVGLLAERPGVDRGRLEAVLLDRPVPDDAALVALTAQIDQVRQEFLHDHAR